LAQVVFFHGGQLAVSVDASSFGRLELIVGHITVSGLISSQIVPVNGCRGPCAQGGQRQSRILGKSIIKWVTPTQACKPVLSKRIGIDLYCFGFKLRQPGWL